jgi:hypothetical protein
MMTRPEMIGAIRAVADPELQDEVDYFLNLDREYEYDEVSALFDIENRMEICVAEADTPTHRRQASRLLRVARRALIDIGFYRVMPPEEIDNTFTSSGRAAWAFKLEGHAYTTDETAEEWQFPEDATDHRTT